MGVKRVVDTDLWSDEKVEMFTPEERYFWLYLLTNPYTKQLGIYHITKKQMSFHLGYDIETISKLLNRFEIDYNLIKYIDNEIAIKNFLKHSILKGGKPVEDCLKSDIKNVKNKHLIYWVFRSLDIENISTTVMNVIKEFNDNDNDNDNDNESIVHDTPTNREVCHKYGEYKNVLLTDEQLEKLKTDYPYDWQERIEKVSLYCQSTGKKYKDYLATIRNWANKDKSKNQKKDIIPDFSHIKNPEFDEELFEKLGGNNRCQ